MTPTLRLSFAAKRYLRGHRVGWIDNQDSGAQESFHMASRLAVLLERNLGSYFKFAFHGIGARKLPISRKNRSRATHLKIICAIKNFMDHISWEKDPKPQRTVFYDIISDDDMYAEYRWSECSKDAFDIDSDTSDAPIDPKWLAKLIKKGRSSGLLR
ncbi:hypothetical protein VKT23_010827 [Stygiomarasmius scandens]|uniref:Uncharacterized protein n=1 Tax=Marasmiellus scandens TaxID=2682957 RepID=A0ABR1JB51_9AGAR